MTTRAIGFFEVGLGALAVLLIAIGRAFNL